VRAGTVQADIMAAIARRLNDAQISDVAVYFAHLAPGTPSASHHDATIGEAPR
jgi:cytochrome c553